MQISIEIHQTDEELPPDFAPVIVSGGVAMRKDGQWFTGMEYPLYERALEWTPKWWMKIPTD